MGKCVEGLANDYCHERGHRGGARGSKDRRNEDNGIASSGEGEEEAKRGLGGDIGLARRLRLVVDRLRVVKFVVHMVRTPVGFESGRKGCERCGMRFGFVNIVANERSGRGDVDAQ